MEVQGKKNTYNQPLLDKIHSLGQAETGKYYYNIKGELYIGSSDGRLVRQQKAFEELFQPTPSIPAKTVQEAIEGAINGFTNSDGTAFNSGNIGSIPSNTNVFNALLLILKDSITIKWLKDTITHTIQGIVQNNTSIQKINLWLSGLLKSTRATINYIAGSGINITITDDSINDKTDVTISSLISSTTIIVDVLDSSGDNYNGSFTGTTSPIYIISPFSGFNQALQFNGVELNNNSSGVNFGNVLASNNEIDIEFRLRLNSTSTDQYIIYKGGDENDGDYRLLFTTASGGTLAFKMLRDTSGTGNGINFYTNNSSGNFLSNINYVIRVCSKTISGNHWEWAYVNGIQVAAVTAPPPSRPLSSYDLVWGRRPRIGSFVNNPLNGIIDEVRIYTTSQLLPTNLSYIVSNSEYSPSGNGLYHLNGPGSITTINSSSLPIASTTKLGITKISYPAMNNNNPIAIGQNDPILPFYSLIYG